MVSVERVRWAPGCKDAGSPARCTRGATEDTADGMLSAHARHDLYFARPSY
jgi:hypothetical protein